MAVTAVVLIESKTIPASQQTQYTSTNLVTIVDKFTATNYGGAVATINVNLVQRNDSASNSNLTVSSRRLQPNETYTFPEVVGHVLSVGDFISTLAGTANSINIRASGRQIT
jgi:hypothetical protein